VFDLARGHVKAIEKLLLAEGIKGVKAYKLDTVNSILVPYILVDCRPGDLAACYADATRAKEELNWVAEMSLEDMVKDSWHWQSQNPKGYKT
jgi:UDP-glucose 4-epimerase